MSFVNSVFALQLLTRARNRVQTGRSCDARTRFLWNNVRRRLKALRRPGSKVVRVHGNRLYFLLKANHRQFLFCVHPYVLNKPARYRVPRKRSTNVFFIPIYFVNLFDDQCRHPLDWSLCSTIVRFPIISLTLIIRDLEFY